jgi:hypothetical protein
LRADGKPQRRFLPGSILQRFQTESPAQPEGSLNNALLDDDRGEELHLNHLANRIFGNVFSATPRMPRIEAM